jgi:predicted SprT family Zn-dependent metalloprotease
MAGGEDVDVCGETYDHKLRLIDKQDGVSTYECRECGAEIFEEDES